MPVPTAARVPRLDSSRPDSVVGEEILSGLAAMRERFGASRLDAALAVSMLHAHTLATLALFAEQSVGAVLEIGPYVGGSTLALCAGAAPERRIVSIELGGANLTHPKTRSSDIIGDLRRNLAAAGHAGRVSIVEGFAQSVRTRALVERELGGQPIGLIAIDADGSVGEELAMYAPLMADDCLVMIDDYEAPGAPEKSAVQRPWVDYAVQVGHLRRYAILPWSTWFGRVGGRAGRESFLVGRYQPESGLCFLCDALLPTPPDAVDHATRSGLRLLEDGVELGPAHSLHEEIRRLGGGRFSHWFDGRPPLGDLHAATIYFSTPDGSDPRRNGRRYEIVAPDGARRPLTT